MTVRAKRIIQWIIAIIVSICLLFGEGFVQQTFLQEKTAINVYAPEDMSEAFKSALASSNLGSQYKINITNALENADICVEYGKENDSEYTKFAFSPFVIAYNSDDDNFKALKKSEVLIPSEFADKFYEIDFLRVIDEVIEEASWQNLGINNNDSKIHVYYPAENTVYWHDFYNFMLLTINGGTYPVEEKDLTSAIQKMERFENSEYTEAVTNFDEKLERTNYFSEICFYILPEKLVYSLSTSHSASVRMIFPLVTTPFNYYFTAKTEIGTTIISGITDKFYNKLEVKEYRSDVAYKLGDEYRNVYDERDVFNQVEIPNINFFTGLLKEKEADLQE